jgi:integrase
MRLTQRGGIWWIDYRDSTGRRRRTSTGVRVDEAGARARATAEGARLIAEDGNRKAAALTLRAAAERTYAERWARAKSAPVMRRIVDVVVRDLGALPLDAVNYGVLRDYCEARLREGKAPATVNRRMSAVGVILREAVRRGERAARGEVPHYRENNLRDRYLSPEEEARLLDQMARLERAGEAPREDGEGGQWVWMGALTALLIDTGMRFGEVFIATTAPDAMALDLRHGATKTGAGRLVPLTRRAAEAYGVVRSSPWMPRLLAMGEKRRWDWCSHRFNRACKLAGIEGVTLHTLRHTCASRLVQRGVSIYTVSKWLGHSSVKVTERYAKLAPDALSQALSALERRPASVEGAGCAMNWTSPYTLPVSPR